MAKAAEKTKTKNAPVESPIQAKDLSLQKRVELYNGEFEAWKTQMSEKYNLMIDCEIMRTPKYTIPRIVLVDLTKNEDTQTEQQQG